jgi:hypothetical protein
LAKIFIGLLAIATAQSLFGLLERIGKFTVGKFLLFNGASRQAWPQYFHHWGNFGLRLSAHDLKPLPDVSFLY